MEITTNIKLTKIYRYFAIIVGELDIRRHITHMYGLPTPTLIILKRQHEYRDMSYRVSTKIRKFLENATLLLPFSLSTYSLTNTTHNLNPQNPHNISHYSMQNLFPKILFWDELKDNHGPWMIVQYSRKRQNQTKTTPNTIVSHQKNCMKP